MNNPMKNSQKTALIVMDMMTNLIKLFGEKGDELIETTNRAIAHAHSKNIPVIFIHPNFRAGLPELSHNNQYFNAIRPMVEKDTDDTLDVRLNLTDKDFVIGKFRMSAFSGNELAILLATQGITHLVMSGVATSGAVLTSVRDSADRDFALTVLSDACADPDRQTHEFLMTKIVPKQANVMTVDEWESL